MGEPFVLALRVSIAIGIDERRACFIRRKRFLDERANLGKHLGASGLVQKIVVHPVEDAHSFLLRSETVEEALLLADIDDPVRAAGEHERRHADRAGIGGNTFRDFVEIEQHVQRLARVMSGSSA